MMASTAVAARRRERAARPGAARARGRGRGPRRRLARARARARETRIAADLALSWALVRRPRRAARAAALASSESPARRSRIRSPGRGSRVGELARAVDARLPAGGAVGGASRPARADVPGRAPWSRPARFAIAGAFAVTLGGQLVGAFVLPDARDLLSVAPQQTVADAVDRAQEISGIAVALAVLFLVLRRLRALRGAARRAQAPLLVAAALTVLAGLLWLGWVIATDGARRRSRRSRGSSRCRSRSGSSPGSSGRGCAGRRRPTSSSSCEQRGGDPARAARPGARRPDARRCVSPRRRPLCRRRRPADRAPARRPTARSRS